MFGSSAGHAVESTEARRCPAVRNQSIECRAVRMKIKLWVAVSVGVLGLAGAAYAVAARDRQIDPDPRNLAVNWRTDDGMTWIDLRPDGTFTAGGISNCVGPIRLLDPHT